MNRQEATSWVWSSVAGLLSSQTNTLADLMGAARDVGRVSLSEIGRRLVGVSAKHGIKRCWRFTANPRIAVSDAMQGVIRSMMKSKRWRRKPVVIALDWVEGGVFPRW
jgi:hypothetical protein